jgi:hypothetical protein
MKMENTKNSFKDGLPAQTWAGISGFNSQQG